MQEETPQSENTEIVAVAPPATAVAEQPTETASAGSGAPADKGHPIAVAIDRLIHRIRDTKFAARRHIPIALDVAAQAYRTIAAELKRIAPLLKSDDRRTVVLAQKELSDILLRFRRLQSSNVAGAIEVGLFLDIFAAFDAFTGDLLRAVYTLKPELFRSLNKTVDFADVLAATSLESLRLQVLDEDTENLRRKSYVDQFAALASRFDVKLTAFARWPDFVECSQRRNLLTHADGVVNEQYRAVCTAQGINSDKLADVGDQLRLGPEYFFDACELVLEVGFKLGQTLWRKTLPTDLEAADRHLMSVLFETLESRVWRRARMIGEFGMAQKHLANDWNRKAILVNHVQALRRDGAKAEALKILSTVDWTSTGHEFRLAELVLKEDYVAAAELMRRIGSKDVLLTEHAYHTWPLFLEFRDTEAFAAAYADVFGHSYAAKLEEAASKASAGATKEAEKQILAGAEVNAAVQRDVAGLEGADERPPADLAEPTPPEG